MNSTVEMVRAAAVPSGRNRFACSLPIWQVLVELGVTFGWRQRGTTYIAAPSSKVEIPARRDYRPGDALDPKCVELEDAMAWAASLEQAKRSAHFDALIAAQGSPADGELLVEELREVLDEFIQYAYGGAFTFALSGEAAPDGRVMDSRSGAARKTP